MRAISLLIILGMALASQVATASPSLAQQRQAFVEARNLQRAGQWEAYQPLRQTLDSYPLAVYLDYYAYRAQLTSVSPSTIRRFVTRHHDLPLANQLQRAYLFHLGERQRWQAFLQTYPSPPRQVTLQCYYYRAQLAQGETAVAFEGARRLWRHGRSRPPECDPLFDAWRQAGDFSNADIWQRMELAFAAGQVRLLSYLVGLLPEAMQGDGKLMAELLTKPEALSQLVPLGRSDERIRAIIASVIPRLARQAPEQALLLWQDYRPRHGFTTKQIKRVEAALVNRLFDTQDPVAIQWRDRWLEAQGTPAWLERRIRLALKQLDWDGVDVWIERYQQRQPLPGRWIYWREQARRHLGESTPAADAYRQLAGERSYYGFLVARELDGPFRLRQAHAEVAPARLTQIAALPAIARITELLHQNRRTQARAEWYYLIRDKTPEQLLGHAEFALRRQWHHYAILATIEGGLWDQLQHRFPAPWKAEMIRFATARQLPRSLLYAVARQESALDPLARSTAGARGLMQLMPATARQTARRLGVKVSGGALYEPEANIRLGSAYLGELLERYEGNHVMAVAAYNAGPHRVDGWLAESGPLPATVWVETIPFRETRGYVKNVLAFNVIYQTLLGDTPTLLMARQAVDHDSE